MSNSSILNECLAHSENIRQRFRHALLNIGKSPDYHVYDLDYDELIHLPNAREKAFLIKVRQFYDGLDYEKKRIFVNEVLEKHRVYPFWFYDYDNLLEFERNRKSVLLSLRSAI